MAEEQGTQYKVFVGGLTWDLTDEELKSGERGRGRGPTVLVRRVPACLLLLKRQQ
jgi:hypothetical protein